MDEKQPAHKLIDRDLFSEITNFLDDVATGVATIEVCIADKPGAIAKKIGERNKARASDLYYQLKDKGLIK